ncbi:MAG: ATP-binding protein [Planctomycetaceae bacterium]|nr:ATP-binding protein [Planctomycetaceae bacterium]
MTTILIVDSSDEEREMIRGLLDGKPSWKLLDVASSAVAKDLLREQQIDMVLVDLSTAGLPEEQFLKYLRFELTQIPTLLLTTDNEDSSAMVEALGIGAVCYVPKSQMARDLLITVERLLGLTGCRRRHARLLESLTTIKSHFRLEGNDISLIPALIGHLVDTAEDFGVTTHGNRTQMAVALDEAMINGIIHGNLEVSSELRRGNGEAFHQLLSQRKTQNPFAERVLHVSGHFQVGEARFTIQDEGPGFDPSSVADPTKRSNLDKPYGRGLFLIRAFMSEVLFNDKGNEITLIKRMAVEASDLPPENGCDTFCE